jgi:hypothetical protein
VREAFLIIIFYEKVQPSSLQLSACDHVRCFKEPAVEQFPVGRIGVHQNMLELQLICSLIYIYIYRVVPHCWSIKGDTNRHVNHFSTLHSISGAVTQRKIIFKKSRNYSALMSRSTTSH